MKIKGYVYIVIQTIPEAEMEELFEPGCSSPAWVTQQNLGPLKRLYQV